jgi:hypothetical protein
MLHRAFFLSGAPGMLTEEQTTDKLIFPEE